MQGQRRETRAFVDRIEEEIAVLLIANDEEMDLPRVLLPEKAKEGDWLVLVTTIDDAETRARRQAARELRARLATDDDQGDLDL